MKLLLKRGYIALNYQCRWPLKLFSQFEGFKMCKATPSMDPGIPIVLVHIPARKVSPTDCVIEYARSGDPAPKASQKSGFSAQRTEFWAPHEVCWRLAFTFCSRVASLITILVGVGIKCICTLTSLRLPWWWPSLESYWPLLLNLNPLTLVVGDGSTRSKWWKNHFYVHRLSMISNFIAYIFFFCSGTAVVVTDSIAFCAFFARIFCTAVMLDYYGEIWNMFGSGRRGASTESSWTSSDCRGWAVGLSGMSSFIPAFPTLNKIRRVLVCMDRFISTAMGRPCAIHDDEYVCCTCACNFLPKFNFFIPALTSNYLSIVTTSTGIIQIRNNDSSNPKINHL